MKLPEGLPEPELIIELRKPVTVKGGGFDALRLREPTAIEMWRSEAHTQSDAGPEAITLYLRELVAQVTGIKADDLESLPITVLSSAAVYFCGFTEAGLEDAEIGLVDERPDHWDVPLRDPVTVAGMQYAELALSEPTTGTVRKAQSHLRKGIGPQSLRSYQMWLVTNASGVPYQVVQGLPVSTLNAAATYLQGFIAPGRQTGRT